MKINELKEYINSTKFNEVINKLHYDDNARDRYLELINRVKDDGDYHLISSCGRSEIIGNHTDHQNGHVVGAAINIDNIGCFKNNNSNIVNIHDNLFGDISVDISDLKVNKDEYNTTNSLIRGVSNKLNELNYKIGGFNLYTDTKVLAGSGISSSACFEVMIVEVFNYLFNEDKISNVDRAIISKYAENVYFGKPSGLLDQMIISCGGFTTIDFKDPNKPVINSYDFNFNDYGYNLLLVNTKGSHADLSNEYGAVPNEIKEVCKLLGINVLSDISKEEFINKFKDIREKINNDRAMLRCLHFYNEDKRAIEFKNCLEKKDINAILDLMNKSGNSSYKYLQNVYPASRPTSQALSIGLALVDDILEGSGAHRVHGGGFDGTIQIICPSDKMEMVKDRMNNIFGDDSVLEVEVRKDGTLTII